jgi:peptidoglycan hydrolase-like protein with peptidoglycan-binding domain
MRTYSLVAALAALTLSAGALAAQSTSQPASKPAMSSSAVHVKQDSTKKAATTAATAKTSTATRHAAWTKDDIKQAQEGLTKAGLYKGKTSGVMNADTRKALREYQKQNKLPVTGRLSDSVLVKLKSA